MILYLKSSKKKKEEEEEEKLTKETTWHHKYLQQSSRIQNQFSKISCLSYDNNEHTENEYRKHFYSQLPQKNTLE
jgi:hypothetical protein